MWPLFPGFLDLRLVMLVVLLELKMSLGRALELLFWGYLRSGGFLDLGLGLQAVKVRAEFSLLANGSF